MNEAPPSRGGKRIGEIVHSAIQSGDFSRLKDLGPAVQETVQDTVSSLTGADLGAPKSKTEPPHSDAQARPAAGPYSRTPARPAWQGQGMVPARRKGAPAGIFGIVLGAGGMAAFGLCGLTFAGMALVGMSAGLFWPLSIACGALFAACGMLLGGGMHKNKLAGRAAQYYALFEKKKVYTFDELAAQLGRTPKQLRKEVRRLRGKGFMKDVRTDADETCVMQGEDVYNQYLETERQRLEREQAQAERSRRLEDPSTAAMEVFRSEGIETIRKIRNANEAIPGEEISEKLARLEATTARIFTYVEGNPACLPDTRKFMDYYLPTTLKLVEKYRQYEEMDFQPDNVKQAKKQIEKSLDTIDLAFNNMLESLYQPDTLDVSTDIDVLEKMLEQEGLTGQRFEIEADKASL